jgi:catalase
VTRQIAVLVAEGFDMKSYDAMKKALEKEGAMVKIIAPHGGTIKCDTNMEHKVDASIMTTESVLFDAIYIPGGKKSVDMLMKNGKYLKFVNETFKHCKAIAVDGEGENLLDVSYVAKHKKDKAIHINVKPSIFIKSIAKHRNWDRMEHTDSIPV